MKYLISTVLLFTNIPLSGLTPDLGINGNTCPDFLGRELRKPDHRTGSAITC